MATQHTYFGEGDPNDNPELELTGDNIGIHHYQDMVNGEIYISMVSPNFDHAGWARLHIDLPEPPNGGLP